MTYRNAVLVAHWMLATACVMAAYGVRAEGQQDRPTSAPPASLDRFYAVPRIAGTSPDGAAWSPDEGEVAFLWNDGGRPFRDVWIYSLRNSERRQVTRAGSPDSLGTGVQQVEWIGQSGQLAYVLDQQIHVVDRNGRPSALSLYGGSDVKSISPAPSRRYVAINSASGLWVHDLRSPQTVSNPRNVVPVTDGAIAVEKINWSADGSTLAFVLADSRAVREVDVRYDANGRPNDLRVRRAFPGDATTKRRVGVTDAASGATSWIALQDEQHPIWGLGLSKDGKRLFLDSSDFLAKTRTIYWTERDSRQLVPVFTANDPKQVLPSWQAAWGPDYRSLLVLSDQDRFFHLYSVSGPGARPVQLTRGEWEVASFQVDYERGRIFYVSNQAHVAERHVYRLPASGGAAERLTEMPGSHSFAFSPKFNFAVDLFSNDATPPDLYLTSPNKRAPATMRRITSSPQAEFSQLEVAQVEYVEFPSHVDGVPLIGRLTRPAGYVADRRYPLIVGSVYRNTVQNRWGGGTSLPTWGLDQVLAARGFLVLSVNVRGSWGQGKRNRDAQHGMYGGIDVDDIESGVRHLIRSGRVDPSRVGIWGWSYGGLMTLMALSRNPTLYTAGIADAPATNVWHAFPEQMIVMGRPDESGAEARYRQSSALFSAQAIQSPLMILHGTRDTTVLYSDTVALTERLISAGRLFELVPFPGSNHVWADAGIDRQLFGYRKMLEFFERHLATTASGSCDQRACASPGSTSKATSEAVAPSH